jgi:hypothetical protein
MNRLRKTNSPRGRGTCTDPQHVQRCGPASWSAAVAATALWWIMIAPATAQPLLSCGVPVVQHLNSGAVDAFRVQVADGSVVSVDVRDDMGVLGLIKLHTSGSGGTQETCTGTIMVDTPGETLIEVSDCIGSDAGDYTLTASVVAAGADNCGIPLPCGPLPSVFDLAIPGAVGSFVFDGIAGQVVTLQATDLEGTIGFVRQRVFDPDGDLVPGADSCASTTRVVTLQKTGRHTLLVSACGLPQTGLYALSTQRPSCPAGPEITYFGLAHADGRPAEPDAYDESGRAVFKPAGGSGFYVVVEARPGSNGFPVGSDAYAYDPENPAVLPDLQVIFSQRLGNGSAAVCDKVPGMQGGVPAAAPFEFSTDDAVSHAINDFGCRVDNGAGGSEGVSSMDACTQFSDGSSHFVNDSSTLQFCAPIAAAWAFSRGATVVQARVRDAQETFGAAREIIVQVAGGPDTPTPQPTLTPSMPMSTGAPTMPLPTGTSTTRPPTGTPTGTPLPTAPSTGTPTTTSATLTPTITGSPIPQMTPSATATVVFDGCPCDCNHDYSVTIDELIQGMTILMGLADLDTCPEADTHGDGAVTVDEIIQGVNATLNGCPSR